MELPSQVTNADPIFQFARFVDEQKRLFIGRNGRNEPKEFLPPGILIGYWTLPKIRAVLNCCRPPLIHRDYVVQTRFLRVFSTVVYANIVPYFPAFTQNGLSDEQFPRDKAPSNWASDAPIYKEIFSKFSEHQWTFFPLVFDPDRLQDLTLAPEHILPLVLEDTIKQGDAARVCKITVHDSCNALSKTKDKTVPNTFVLKTYKGERFRQLYNNEYRALTALQNNVSEHVVAYYGSFVQGDGFNLLLEFVNGGNLLDYYKNTTPPQTAEDVLYFWKSISHIFQGLHRVHQEVSGESDEYRLVHEDMKPDNILLSRQNRSSNYDFSPKVADFGYSHVRLVHANSRDGLALDRHGNQTYCAPECSHHARYLRKGTNRITSEADIFSVGAILSDAASWVVLGLAGRHRYHSIRVKASTLEPEFKDSGYEGCFHDGVERLGVVDSMHHNILETIKSSRPFDHVTAGVIHLIQEHMLLRDATHRLKASQLYQKFEHILRDAEENITRASTTHTYRLPSADPNSSGRSSSETIPDGTPSSINGHRKLFSEDSKMSDMSLDGYHNAQGSPSSSKSERVTSASPNNREHSHVGKDAAVPDKDESPMPPSPAPDQRPTGSASANKHASLIRNPSGPVLKLSEAKEYRNAKKNSEEPDRTVAEIIKQLQSNLDGRDHLVFIDDSESMAERKPEIEEAFEALAYIAKSIDSNGVELVFASKPKEVFKNKRTSPLLNILKKHKYTHIADLMENKLGHLFEDVIIPRLPRRIFKQKFSFGCKPITVFIFTDGKWGTDSSTACGVEKPVRDLIDEINDRRLRRTEVMLQFIRFGDDEDGKKHLTYLDQFGEQFDCDIVDSQPITGNVYSMFLGAISQNIDRESGS